MHNAIIGLINQYLPDALYLAILIIIIYARQLLKTWLPKIEAWVEAHTTEKQRKIIKDLGHEAFVYAETRNSGKSGAEKLQAALMYFNKCMDKYGLSALSSDTIRAAIERAWLEDKRKELPVMELVESKVGGTE